jgi:CRP/FNR family cyclic AMP-dependent transcriptional regulator
MSHEPVLSKIDLFKGLDAGALAEIEAIAESRTYDSGDVLFGEGSRGDELYVVKRGKVRIDLKLQSDSDCATVHRLREGQILGELALVDRRARSATATCETPSEIVALNCDKLLDLFERNRDIGYLVIRNLVEIVATRLRKTNLQLVATVCWE